MNRTRRHSEIIHWPVASDCSRVAILEFVYESTLDRHRSRLDIVATAHFCRWLTASAQNYLVSDFDRLLSNQWCLASLYMARRDSEQEFYLSGLQNTLAADTGIYVKCNRTQRRYFSGLAAFLLRSTLARFAANHKHYFLRLTALGTHAEALERRRHYSRARLERYYTSLGFTKDDGKDYSIDGTAMCAPVSRLLQT